MGINNLFYLVLCFGLNWSRLSTERILCLLMSAIWWRRILLLCITRYLSSPLSLILDLCSLWSIIARLGAFARLISSVYFKLFWHNRPLLLFSWVMLCLFGDFYILVYLSLAGINSLWLINLWFLRILLSCANRFLMTCLAGFWLLKCISLAL